jgi:hypothetical protein
MNKYRELKQRHQTEVNNFPIKFAFTNEQFEKGMQELGLAPTDTDKVYSISGGGFIRKTDAQAFGDMFKRHGAEMQKEIDADTTGENFIKDMFTYELGNHEYGYTGDLSDTLDSLDLTMDKINNSPNLLKGLQLAIAEYKDY